MSYHLLHLIKAGNRRCVRCLGMVGREPADTVLHLTTTQSSNSTET